jgi:acetyl esterase/lipase
MGSGMLAKRQRRGTILTLLTTSFAGILVVLATQPPMGKFWQQWQKPAAAAPVLSQAFPAQVNQQQFGEGALTYWVYTPVGGSQSTAPVVLFLHGWMAIDPYYYGGWIDHLVKSGNIVIYPAYQASRQDTPDQIQQNVIQATRNALTQLQTSSSVKPDLSRFTIVGHSLGGGLAVQVASVAPQVGLPTPRAVMPVQPGWQGSRSMPTGTLGQISPATYLLIVEATNDQFKDTRQGSTIYDMTPQIPVNRKTYVLISSSDPTLISDHSAPTAPLESYRGIRLTGREKRRAAFNAWLANQVTGLRNGEIDAMDRNGFWVLFDQLRQSAFSSAPAIAPVAGPAAASALSPEMQNPATIQRLAGGDQKQVAIGTPSNPAQFIVTP